MSKAAKRERDTLQDDPARIKLLKAQQRRDAARTVRDKIASSIERATAMINSLQAELRAYDGLDGHIAQQRAEQIKQSLSIEGSSVEFSISPELTAMVTRRAETENWLSAMQQACDTLRSELEASGQVVAQVEQAVHECALAIIAPEAEAIGIEMMRQEARAHALRKRLLAYSTLRRRLLGIGDSQDWLPLPPILRTALREVPINPGIDAVEVKVWRDAFNALLTDHDATVRLFP